MLHSLILVSQLVLRQGIHHVAPGSANPAAQQNSAGSTKMQTLPVLQANQCPFGFSFAQMVIITYLNAIHSILISFACMFHSLVDMYFFILCRIAASIHRGRGQKDFQSGRSRGPFFFFVSHKSHKIEIWQDHLRSMKLDRATK